LYGRNPEEIKYFSIDNARKRISTYGQRIFVNIDTDTFHEKHPIEVIQAWFDLFASFPEKQFQILTKRSGRMLQYFKDNDCPTNCWIGVSIEDQGHLFRLEALRRVPARIHFVSFEPLLGPIVEPNLDGIEWVIIGGESDSRAPRPMNPEWAQGIVDYAQKFYPKCAVFFKQHGGKGGDNAGGNVLFGKTYMAFPSF